MKQLSKLVWVTAAAIALVVAMGAASPAAAQVTPQIAAGYQFLRSSPDCTGCSSTNLPLGWFADVAFSLPAVDRLSIVGDVSGAYKSETINNVDTDSKIHTFMGGVRYGFPQSGMLTPFVQALFGGANSRASGGGTSLSSTAGALGFGGGVNFELNDQWTARVGVDYRRIFEKTDAGVTWASRNEFRIVAGVIIPIGG